MNSMPETRPLSAAARAVAAVDLVLGIGLVAISVILVVASLLPAPPGHDNAIIGLLGGLAILPFGLAALAASHALRHHWSARWILQLLAAVPFIALAYVIVTNWLGVGRGIK
jgi:hypothetical protein